MSSPNKSLLRWPRAVAVLLFVAGLTVALWQSRQDRELPSWQVTSAVRPFEIERCAACHEPQCAAYRQTPHFNTLRAGGTAGAVARWDRADLTAPGDGWRYQYAANGGQLWLNCSGAPGPRRVDWMFGSGRHAETPVTVAMNSNGEPELIEHRVSWYADGAWGLTLGRDPQERVDRGLAAVGKWHSPSQTWQCFGCHASHLPPQGKSVAFDRLLPGIHCIRCHADAERHAAAMEAGEADPGAGQSAATPLEAIHRCGECHRRADQFPDDELVAENRQIVRFAPVGLALSRCFQAQDQTTPGPASRLDCLTCHDPHQPASDSPLHYRQKCLACHEDASKQTTCPQQPLASDCLACHMPKVASNRHLSFTDHWIRVRRGDPE